MRSKAKKKAIEFVSAHMTTTHFLYSREHKDLEAVEEDPDWQRISIDFEREFELDKGALDEFARLEDIKEARFRKAIEKFEAEQANKKNKKKRKKKMPSFKDFRAFIKRKTGVKV